MSAKIIIYCYQDDADI